MPTVIPIDSARRRHAAAAAAATATAVHPGFDRAVAIPRFVERGASAPSRAAEPVFSEIALAAHFFPLAAAVVAVDLLTKAWAVASLAGQTMVLTPWLSLSLAFNRASAGGVSLGEHTRALNFMMTGIVVAAVVMLAPTLTRLDRRAWRALALIAGAGVGNMISLATGTHGVPDFIALRSLGRGAWVLNVADVVLVVGLVLLMRTVIALARVARRDVRAVRPARAV